jgi:ubiquinone/menaquinone biosynthesis C-methylase UbiE
MRMTLGPTDSWKIAAFFVTLLAASLISSAQTPPPAPEPVAPTPTNPAVAEPPPGITEYMGRTVAQTMHYEGAAWLVRTKREREEAGSLMREKLELKPGMMVCDLGCGNGYHTFPIAKAVAPVGKVYGVEIQAPYLKMLEEGAKKHGVTNFVPVLGELHDPKLPDNTFDLILLVDVYHEFSHPVHMLAAMRKSLKPDGALVLVEFRAEDDDVPIKPEHKMTKAQVNKELTANGYKLVKEFDGLPWQHMMWFGKADK